MDRRSLVIVIVILSELLFRLISGAVSLPVDPLLYTAGVRFVQMALILSFAFDLCGVKTRNLPGEVLIGIGVSAAFGGLVFLADLASRLLVPGGALKILLARAAVPDPLLFFFVGCVLGPFVEELFFRGLFYSSLRERLPVAGSVLISALVFAGLHPSGFAVQVIGGLIFALLFEWRKSIWAPYTLHAAANFGIMVLPWVYPF